MFLDVTIVSLVHCAIYTMRESTCIEQEKVLYSIIVKLKYFLTDFSPFK